MGINSSCQEEWCVKPAEMYCECIKKSYCSPCFLKHMSRTSESPHKAYSTNPKSDAITYKILKYLKSDKSTEVYDGAINSVEVIIKIQYFTSKRDLNRKQEEAALQRSTKHPHICKCIKSYIDETYTSGFKFVMVMEKAIKDLDEEINDRILKGTFWTEVELCTHLANLVDALAFMQANSLAHRDIKPANILLFPMNVLKLADFGLSIEQEGLETSTGLTVVGTLLYLSPKLTKAYNDIQNGVNTSGTVNHNPYKSDMYSLGLTFLYMASLTEPAGLNYNIEGTTYLKHRIAKTIELLKYSQEFKNIISMMLEIDENQRVDFLALQSFLKPHSEPIIMSLDVSEIPVRDTSEEEEISPLALSLPQILNDPCLPTPIKAALNGVLASKTLQISHTLLLNEAEYIKIAMQGADLTVLDLSDCNLGYKGLKIIMQADLAFIETLSLGNNNLGRRGGKILMRNMEKLLRIKVLRLWSNRLGDKGIEHIFENISENIEELFLADNGVSENGAKIISRNLPKKLKMLSLSDNAIGDKGARVLSIGLSKLESIAHVYLDNNGIGPIGAKYLISYLPSTMKTLRIIGNNLSAQLASSFAMCKYKISI